MSVDNISNIDDKIDNSIDSKEKSSNVGKKYNSQEYKKKVEDINRRENTLDKKYFINDYRESYKGTELNGDVMMLLGLPIGADETWAEGKEEEVKKICKFFNENNITVESVSNSKMGNSRDSFSQTFTLSNGIKIDWNSKGNFVDTDDITKQLIEKLNIK